MSISISPAIQTTPALDSLFPVYYEDLTEEQKENGVSFNVRGNFTPESVLTITPTADWYCICTNAEPPIVGEKGAAITVNNQSFVFLTLANGLDPEEQGFKAFKVSLTLFT